MAENLDVFYFEVKSRLQKLKADKLEEERLLDIKFDIIQSKIKIRENIFKQIFKRKSVEEIKQKVLTDNKTTMSIWSLKRLARKNQKQRKRIEKGYIKAVNKCIKILDKVFKEYE